MDPYVVYYLLGLAESEESKVFHWAQWEQCFNFLNPLFEPYANTSVIKPMLAFEIPLKSLKSDPPGTRRVTYKSFSLGRLRWSFADNQKWSKKLVEEGEYPLRFLEARILSSNSKENFPEIQVSIFNFDTSPGSAFNQILSIAISQSNLQSGSIDFWDGLINDLSPILHVVRIARTTRPWWLERPRGAYTEGSSLADGPFTTRYDSLELNDSWQTWEYLK